MKAKKPFFRFILTVIIWLSSVHYVHAQEDPASVKNMIDKYNKRLESIQQLTSQEEELQGQLSTINRQIFEYDKLVSELKPDIDKITMKMESIQTAIDETNHRIDSRNGLLRNRLKSMYANDNTSLSFIEVLLGSTDFDDFINRIGMLTLIIKQDKQMIDTMTEDKTNLSNLKEELNQQQQILLAKQDTLNNGKAEQEKKVTERAKLLDQLQKKKMNEIDKSQKEAENLASIDATKLTPDAQAQLNAALQKIIVSDGVWDWPVPSSHLITSDFGSRGEEFHAGIDIGAPLGTSIVSVDNGVVLYAGKATGFGNWIVIKHANGLMSVYGHMYGDGIYISVGQEVKRGQIIAVVGDDGQSTGPHLHFAVATGITGNKMDYTDPHPYLNNEHL